MATKKKSTNKKAAKKKITKAPKKKAAKKKAPKKNTTKKTASKTTTPEENPEEFKNSVGKPLILSEITPQILNQISAMCAYGMTVPMVADCLGLKRSTFYEYIQRNPEMKIAMRQGRARGGLKIDRSLFNKAVKGDVQAIRWFDMTRRGINPDNGVNPDVMDEKTDLALLSDQELDALELLLEKATPKNEEIEGEFSEVND